MTAAHILRNLSDVELIRTIENCNASASELELIRRYDELGQSGGLDRKMVSIKVNEAKGCYPREDFLSSAIKYINENRYRNPSRQWPHSHSKPLLTKKFAAWLIVNDPELTKELKII